MPLVGLRDLAREQDVDATAMATRGRSGVSRVVVGSVAAESRDEGLAYLRAERLMYLEDKAEQLRGLRVSTRVEALAHGEEISEGIARIAAETHASLVVLASAHASSAAAAVLGSVGQGVLARSPCPVVIVRCPSTKPRPATGAG